MQGTISHSDHVSPLALGVTLTIDLDGLTALSDAVAQALAQHQGKLDLSKHLPDSVSSYAPQK